MREPQTLAFGADFKLNIVLRPRFAYLASLALCVHLYLHILRLLRGLVLVHFIVSLVSGHAG